MTEILVAFVIGAGLYGVLHGVGWITDRRRDD